MTRYELIKKKANELCNDPANDYKSTEDLCIMMAEWADENPDINPDEEVLSKINSNAYKAWIEKACEILSRFNIEHYRIGDDVYSMDLVRDFKKAMEKQQ